ncbi:MULTISPECIES: rod shape-determining protein MreC [Thermoanaerobacterium]|uniref:Cell shape-determining protein MreC n=1 Tax=Thermoanaerobacterium xylanolyticum (strain ATCC 49914 / DSM 7097 / LX-11) TaxID=858215 RepID=F6BHD3_THEXL|nr:rod shape-determining protein MreC [Thermoanaerobacterium xylanolyticum]AEF17606.1 rod shape-determining protein MreC [Thermoanaerobacterium xylanolyticum LX-11]
MPRFLKNKQFIFVIVIAVALISAMAYTYGGGRNVTPIESAIGGILSPVEKVFYSVGNSISNFFTSIKEIGTLRAKNAELEKEVIKLSKNDIMLQEYINENDRLRDMLNFKDSNANITTKPANIISKNPGNWFNTFNIDVGSDNGIKPKMAVLDEKGNLVGIITDVGNNWAKVLSIIDVDSSVSALDVRTRDNGIVRGDSNGNLNMIYIPIDSKIEKGDVITTSDMSMFPRGLIIGRVEKVEKDEGSLLKQAVIKPEADFERLEFVQVVTNMKTTGN